MSTLRDISIAPQFEGLGDEISRNFIGPALACSVSYDRLSSYFTTESLVACGFGMDSLWSRNGRMRLLLGVHAVPHDLATASTSDASVDELVAKARQEVLEGCRRLTDIVARNRVGALAMMLREGFLTVKVSAPLNRAGLPSGGIMHGKRILLRDSDGNRVVATGSPNETGNALSVNFEELTVHTSWDELTRVEHAEASFARIWEGRRPDLAIRDLDAGFAAELLAAIRLHQEQPDGKHPRSIAVGRPLEKIFSVLRSSPEFAFANVGKAALFPHQERTLRDALSRWPIRVLLADEVGLGKTIEAGCVVAYARKFLGVRRVLVLTPAGLRRQWQSELREHFGIEAWRYEPATAEYVSAEGFVRRADRNKPLLGAPEVLVISWQLARGSWRDSEILKESEWCPDLILVDEAHSARRYRGLDGNLRTTLVWDLVDEIGANCAHLVLLTATPMQMQIEEYHGLLLLLGLPSWWTDDRHFTKFLRTLGRFQRRNELADTQTIVQGVAAGLEMLARPDGAVDPGSGLDVARLLKAPLRPADLIPLREKGAQLSELSVRAAPPALLSVRNTRSALSKIGYQFPTREFRTPTLQLNEHGHGFLRRIASYLREAYGAAEKQLGLSDGGASTFVQSIYYQRLVSSLTSARRTLDRRAGRLDTLIANGQWNGEEVEAEDEIDSGEGARIGTRVRIRVELESAKQAARIERQYIKEMSADLEKAIGEGKDPKITAMRAAILEGLAACDSILIFTRFTDTLDACIDSMRELLVEQGVGFGRYSGGESWVLASGVTRDVDKTELCEALRKKEIAVVFCSDAASEGLNLQTARRMINVDVPWNPARLEQRIGRIARLGQKAKTVIIHNLWYPGTVEEQMYSRLLARQDLYELAVGEFPDIVGECIAARLAGNSVDFNGIEHDLNERRSRAEMRALRKVWAQGAPQTSQGQFLRNVLMELVVKIAKETGRLISCADSRVEVSVDEVSCTADSAPGQHDSLTLHHAAVRVLAESQVHPSSRDVVSKLAVLCVNGHPSALLYLENERYRVLGVENTMQLVGCLLSGEGMPAFSGPLISGTPSPEEAADALRQAFHGRVEVGDVRTGGILAVSRSPRQSTAPEIKSLQNWESATGFC